MSVVMRDFINGNNFTCPRLPIHGEDKDRVSCVGAGSIHSSGSYRSHISAKSISSEKSSQHSDSCQLPLSPRKFLSPSRNRSPQKSRSPSLSLTPRKSRLNKALTTNSTMCDDSVAPLGFEPEGSDVNSPGCSENSSTPAYQKWAENLNCLLEDGEGVKLFRQFLDQEQCANILDFWFACRGMKLVAPSDRTLIVNLVKLIYKKYIKANGLPLKSDIKRRIVQRLKQDQIDQDIYNEAQAEIEGLMQSETYPLFLKSDIYLLYVQHSIESPRTSNNSSGSDNLRPLLGLLPTVHEGHELKSEDIKAIPSETSLSLTETSLNMTRKTRENWTFSLSDGLSLTRAKVPHPYHVSYAPVSTLDSEIQSLSSEAMTEDAVSHNDMSLENEVSTNKPSSMKQLKSIRQYASANPGTDLNQQLIPRTDRIPRDRNLAGEHPAKFASMLIDKLQQLRDEEDKLERIRQSMKSIDSAKEPSMKSSKSTQGMSSATLKSNQSIHSMSSFPSSILFSTDADDSAQSILEDHVSRVWDATSSQFMYQSSDNLGGYASSGEANMHRLNVSSCLMNSSYQPRPGSRNAVGSTLSSTSTFDSGVVKDDVHRSLDFGVDYHPYHHKHTTSHGMLHDVHGKPKAKVHPRSMCVSDTEAWDNSGIGRSCKYSRRSIDVGSRDLENRPPQHLNQTEFMEEAASRLSYLTDLSQKYTTDLSQTYTDYRENYMMPSAMSRSTSYQPSKSKHSVSSGGPLDLSSVLLRSAARPKSEVKTASAAIDYPPVVALASKGATKPTVPAVKPAANPTMKPTVTIVGYYFCDEKIPYRTTIPGQNITLAQFKNHISKKGNFRYFFKKACDEFDSGVVHEEYFDDNDILPLWDGKIFGKIERKQQ